MPDETAGVDLPLSGLRVLDLADARVASVGQMLASLGAEVVILRDSIAGDWTIAEELGHRGKAVADVDASDGAALAALAAQADIVIESAAPGSPPEGRLDIDALRRSNPRSVVLSITDFGQSGPLAHWTATPAVLGALSGVLARSGLPGLPPLLPPGEILLEAAMPQAVVALLIALAQREESGIGDHIDFALLDAVAQCFDPAFGTAGSASAGVMGEAISRDRPDAAMRYPIFAAQDGKVRICVLSPKHWTAMFDWLGQPAEFSDPDYARIGKRFADWHRICPLIADLFRTRTSDAIVEEGQKRGIPIAAVLDFEQALALPDVAARIERRAVAGGASVKVMPNPVTIDGQPLAAGSPPAPWKGAFADAAAASGPIAASAKPDRPLDGIRILDLGVIVVGSDTSRLLADYGADVIKIESTAFPDGLRQSATGNFSPSFARGHRNKRSLGLDLRDPRGKALFLELAAKSDVILSNFKPGTMDALGFSRAALHAVNPRLVIVESSAFGKGGEAARRLGYGPLVRAASGLTDAWSYPGEAGESCDAVTVYPDHTAARIGAAAALALLHRRLRTGRGGEAAISQLDVIFQQMNRTIAATDHPGHGDLSWSGVLRCRGDDEWCAVTVRDAADWTALCDAIGRPEIATAAPFAAAEGAWDMPPDALAALTAWTVSHAPEEVMRRLQDAGVAAGMMLRVEDLADFDHYAARSVFNRLHQPQLEEPLTVDHATIRSCNLRAAPLNPAPLAGEHSAAIARDLLGLGEDDVAALFAAGILQRPGG